VNPLARRIQRTYLTLVLGNTLAASFIWGINTLFLLDAGLSNLEAFAANAFFTAGMVIFEVPTGVVADTWGRRTSYLLGTLTLSGSTFLYWVLWATGAPFWSWAVVSMLLGLGFTFFSGAVEAWLVDALHHAGHDGGLEAVLGRGQMIGGAAMLGGSVAGGVIAQATSLGVPFLLRVGVLLVMFAVAYRLMYDLGFTPAKSGNPLQATREVFDASIEHGLGNPPVRWMMLAAPFASGVGFYTFYALQPFLLELYGDPDAYDRADPRRRGERADPRAPRLRRLVLAGALPARPLGLDLRGRHADPAGVPERHDPVTAACDCPVVRLADGLERRRRDPAGARQDRRRLQLCDVLRRRLSLPACIRSVPRAEPP
jgi:MFS family permease